MILLIGPSASGKTEISKLLGFRYGISKAITHTTRAPRKGEVYGVDYYFVQEEDFLQLMKKGAFVENTVYNGNHYGCSKAEIADDKVVVVDPNGLKSFLSLKDPSVVTFFLNASEETRRKRMEARKDKPEDIEKRLLNDKEAFSSDKIQGIDYFIDTDKRSMESLVKEIYEDYVLKLKERGIQNPNIIH